MDVVQISDQKAWNEFLLSQPTQAGIFLQCWEWGEFQEAVGRRVYRYQGQDSFAQVIELPLLMKKKYWFIPRGTLIDGLEEDARKQGILFVRFEPTTSSLILPHQGGGPRESISIQPKQTLVMDLSKSEDELLAGMHEKTRYNIRLALRKGVEVREGTFDEFWKLMQETAKRDKFRTHPREYYEKMLDMLHNSPQPSLNLREGDRSIPPLKIRGGGGGVMYVRLHMAYHGITPIAGAIVGYFGDTATYLHGASAHEHRSLMAPYALHWEIMKEAKKEGYKFYDFWGVNTTNYELKTKNSWAGMTRFKIGFGGTVVDYPGTFDLPLNRLWYTVYRLGRKVL